jgi:hypothetical protein
MVWLACARLSDLWRVGLDIGFGVKDARAADATIPARAT